MNQQNFEQDLIQTLELCLSKMSQKLKTTFDPCDKIKIQLLQQFRSTITIYHTCLKRAGKGLDQPNTSIQKTKPAHNQKSNQPKQSDQLTYLTQAISNKEKEITQMLKQQHKPSGLLMTLV